MTNRRYLLLVICLIALISLGAFFANKIPKSGEAAMREFYSQKVMEGQLMDPLILAGREAVPHIIKEIQNKNMHRRRYAIGALGIIGDSAALEVLEKILQDSSEEEYFRCDSLESISQIDTSRGKKWAGKYGNNAGCLSDVSKEIPGFKMSPKKRSFMGALLGWNN